MQPSPLLLSVVGQFLVLSIIALATALLILRRQKRQLSRLSARQTGVIKRLKDKLQNLGRNPGKAAHARDTLAYLQTEYRQHFSQTPEPPARAVDERDLEQIVMATAVRTLSAELQAEGDGLDPTATWAGMREELQTILRAPCGPSTVGPDTHDASSPAPDRHHAAPGPREGAPSSADATGNDTETVGEVTRRALLDSLSKNENELNELRNRMAEQMELAARLQERLAGADPDQGGAVLEEIERLTGLLRESETCVTVLEMEVDNAHTCATRLQAELDGLRGADAAAPVADIEALRQQNRALTERTATLEEAKQRLEHEVARLQDDFAAAEREYEMLHARYRDLKEQT